MREPKIFTAEVFRYNTDRRRSLRVHPGRFEQIRDSLTPVMIWTREFYATTRKEATTKGRKLAQAMDYKFAN